MESDFDLLNHDPTNETPLNVVSRPESHSVSNLLSDAEDYLTRTASEVLQHSSVSIYLFLPSQVILFFYFLFIYNVFHGFAYNCHLCRLLASDFYMRMHEQFLALRAGVGNISLSWSTSSAPASDSGSAALAFTDASMASASTAAMAAPAIVATTGGSSSSSA